MAIDFEPVFEDEQQLSEYAAQFSVDDLRQASEDSVAWLAEIVQGLADAEIGFAPQDPEADDPFAGEDEQEIGWGMGHLVAHVTASCEEWAGYSSLLARSVRLSCGAAPALRDSLARDRHDGEGPAAPAGEPAAATRISGRLARRPESATETRAFAAVHRTLR